MGFKLRDIAATAGRYVRQAARMAGRGALAALTAAVPLAAEAKDTADLLRR